LDEVHNLIESLGIKFILSGSSARKLKRGGANLLAGRAVTRTLHPFSVKELGNRFNLNHALQFGTLPPLLDLDTKDSVDVLKSYVEVYLREEIQIEGLVRNLGGYTRFLDITASYIGEILNMSSLAKESKLPAKTVQSYFSVLKDTLLVVELPAWKKSPVKRLTSHPKFYLFDNGVTNALTHRLAGELDSKTEGHLFEQFMIQETNRIASYSLTLSKLYYWRTKDGSEVDLLIEKNGELIAAIEFKNRDSVSSSDIRGLNSFLNDNPDVPSFLVCRCKEPFTLQSTKVLPWDWYLDELERWLMS
jgi:predicted AAA+ superfamily ATPase